MSLQDIARKQSVDYRALFPGLLPVPYAPFEPNPTKKAKAWLIKDIRSVSLGTYVYRRVHTELTMGMGIHCSSRFISVLMTDAGTGGLSGPTWVKSLKGVATADDLVSRELHRLTLNELWVTDIAEYPTREGKVF